MIALLLACFVFLARAYRLQRTAVGSAWGVISNVRPHSVRVPRHALRSLVASESSDDHAVRDLFAHHAVRVPIAGRTFVPDAAPVVVDLRSPDEFANRHISGACSLPLDQLEKRMFELPPPGEWPVQLVGSREQLDCAQALLSPRGWDMDEIDVNSEPSWLDGYPTQVGADECLPSPYQPNSFLSAALDAIDFGEDALVSEGLVLDLGCGGGRDAVHLATALKARAPRWTVIGVDNHGGALERGRALANRTGIRLEFEMADLRKGGLEELCKAWTEKPLRLVHGCRWLDVPLLAKLPQLLAPGGLVLWSTFLDPPDGSEPLAPPYRRSRRLSSGQMAQLLGEDADMDVLYDVEGELLTRGKWVTAQFFCGLKRGASHPPYVTLDPKQVAVDGG